MMKALHPTSAPAPKIMRYELSDFKWTAIRPMLPNKSRGVRRVNGCRVLNGIFRVLRSGAPWRDLPLRAPLHDLLQSLHLIDRLIEQFAPDRRASIRALCRFRRLRIGSAKLALKPIQFPGLLRWAVAPGTARPLVHSSVCKAAPKDINWRLTIGFGFRIWMSPLGQP